MLVICICLYFSDEFTCVKIFIASGLCVSTKSVCVSVYRNFLKSTLSAQEDCQTVTFWYLQKMTGLLAVQVFWMFIPDTGPPWR